MVELWEAEHRWRTKIITELGHEGIHVIDPLPALQAMLESGVNPYPDDADGHPLAEGYKAIAESVSRVLQ